MTIATTDDVTMDTLDDLIIESIETIRYCKKKSPDEHTIHNIRRIERNLIEVKLEDINGKLAFLIKKGNVKNQSSNGKNSYFILNNIPEITLPMKTCLKLIILLLQLLPSHAKTISNP